jgi:predicted chitinase
VLSCLLRVFGEYWRDHDNNSCCDGNDFIFATHRINSGTNGLQDRQRFSGREGCEKGLKESKADTKKRFCLTETLGQG